MKKIISVSIILSSLTFAEIGNQVQIADLKEAVYKLIKKQKELKRELDKSNKQIVYKMIPREKSYLDGYLENYVKNNKHLLPVSGKESIK